MYFFLLFFRLHIFRERETDSIRNYKLYSQELRMYMLCSERFHIFFTNSIILIVIFNLYFPMDDNSYLK